MVEEFGFNNSRSPACSVVVRRLWVGQLVNGCFVTDRRPRFNGYRCSGHDRHQSHLRICVFRGHFSTFALIWLLNGYFQSFGSPGMIKINAAWFNRSERGTFSGIFGFMIQLGQVRSITWLPPSSRIRHRAWVVGENQWRWLFRIPP